MRAFFALCVHFRSALIKFGAALVVSLAIYGAARAEIRSCKRFAVSARSGQIPARVRQIVRELTLNMSLQNGPAADPPSAAARVAPYVDFCSDLFIPPSEFVALLALFSFARSLWLLARRQHRSLSRLISGNARSSPKPEGGESPLPHTPKPSVTEQSLLETSINELRTQIEERDRQIRKLQEDL